MNEQITFYCRHCDDDITVRSDLEVIIHFNEHIVYGG